MGGAERRAARISRLATVSRLAPPPSPVRFTEGWPAGARDLGAALEVALAATAVHRAEGQPTRTRILIAALELARLDLPPVCVSAVKV